MIRGTTPKHTFKMPQIINKNEIAALYITYNQCDKITLEKTLNDVIIIDNKIIVTLSQADTLLFDERGKVKVQLRYKDTFGNVIASNVYEVPVEEILKEGEI